LEEKKPVVMQACYCSITVAVQPLDGVAVKVSTVLQLPDVMAELITMPRNEHLQLEKETRNIVIAQPNATTS